MTTGLFDFDGSRYHPTEAALSPWGSDRLHGGPLLGLLAHAARQQLADPGFILSRFTADLFARVPNAPLQLTATTLRKGRRLGLIDVDVMAEGEKVARASALFCAPAHGSYHVLDQERPEGPEGLETRPLIAQRRVEGMPPGFHLEVETRFGHSQQGLGRTIWFRMPMPLLTGEKIDPLLAAIALSDFGNAVNSIAAYEDSRRSAHMNTDTTFYLERPPQGEWFAMTADMQSDVDGISIGQTVHHDVHGRFGRSLQTRLETAFR